MADTLAGDQPSIPSPQRKALRVGWLTIFVVCSLLYGLTANRGAQWQDSGMQIVRIMTGELVPKLGLALSHPLHHWLGRLAILPGLGEPSAVITLISALAAAIAVANVYGCVLTVTDRPGCALFAAASLAVAHTFWKLATVTEIYTLSAALLAGESWALASFIQDHRRRALLVVALCNGLGIANHLAAILTTPVLAIVGLLAVRQRRISRSDAVYAVILWLLATTPYTGLVLAEIMRTGQWGATLHSAFFGVQYSQNVLNFSLSGRMIVSNIGFPLLNFPSLFIPAALLGIWRSAAINVPRILRRALIAALLLNIVFVMRYNVVDQYTFFLPVYVLLAVFAGIGGAVTSATLSDKARTRLRSVAWPLLIATPLLYVILPTAARHMELLGRFKHNKPYRDDYVYLLTPWSGAEPSAERMSTEALALAGEEGLIFYEDGMAKFALEYKALRSGMNLDRIRGAGQLAGMTASEATARPVVLVPMDAARPRSAPPTGVWTRHGDLYFLDTTATAPASE